MNDRNGVPIQAGDLVMVPCRVLDITDAIAETRDADDNITTYAQDAQVHMCAEYCNTDSPVLVSVPPFLVVKR